MNHIRLFMALLAACILIMPALSMPENGKCASSDGNLACSACHKLIADEKGGCQGQTPMMGPATDNAREQFCGLCKKSMMGHDGKDEQGCGCEKSMMGWEGKDKQGCGCEKSMMGWEGKDKQGCECQKPMMGHDGKDKQGCGCEKSMMGWEDKDKQGCECQKPMIGEDGKQTWQGQSKEKPFGCQRSMMGEKGKEGNGEVKIVIISVKP
jgi:hypothetical protein